MPDLVLSDDRKQYQDLAADFAANEIAPRAAQLDHDGALPVDICKKAWDIGLLNVRMPEALGGLGLGVFDACVIAEELGAACAGVGAAFWGNDMAVTPLLVAGSAEQKEKYLAPLLGEFSLAACCFQHPRIDGGLHYKRVGDGFALTGTAAAINATSSRWLLVIGGDGAGASSIFVVEQGTDGVTVGERKASLGLKAADLTQVEFHDVKLAAAALVGTAGGAPTVLMDVQRQFYPVLGSYAAGIIKSALQHSVRYAKERRTMGKPIGEHQAVGFLLADMDKDLEAARFMLRKAAWLADNGQPDSSAAAMAKTFACDAAMRAATDAVQVFGGYGYSREYPVEKLMRDAKMMQVYGYSGAADRLLVANSLTQRQA